MGFSMIAKDLLGRPKLRRLGNYREPRDQSRQHASILVIGPKGKRLSSYKRIGDRLGCSVYVSSSPQDLQQQLCERQIGMVILDGPPLSSFREWANMMRVLERDSRVRVVVVRPGTISKESLMMLGATDCIELKGSNSPQKVLPWIDTYLPRCPA